MYVLHVEVKTGFSANIAVELLFEPPPQLYAHDDAISVVLTKLLLCEIFLYVNKKIILLESAVVKIKSNEFKNCYKHSLLCIFHIAL